MSEVGSVKRQREFRCSVIFRRFSRATNLCDPVGLTRTRAVRFRQALRHRFLPTRSDVFFSNPGHASGSGHRNHHWTRLTRGLADLWGNDGAGELIFNPLTENIKEELQLSADEIPQTSACPASMFFRESVNRLRLTGFEDTSSFVTKPQSSEQRTYPRRVGFLSPRQ